MSKPRALDDATIAKIKHLYNFPLYTQKRLAKMFYVDQKTIFNYLHNYPHKKLREGERI